MHWRACPVWVTFSCWAHASTRCASGSIRTKSQPIISVRAKCWRRCAPRMFGLGRYLEPAAGPLARGLSAQRADAGPAVHTTTIRRDRSQIRLSGTGNARPRRRTRRGWRRRLRGDRVHGSRPGSTAADFRPARGELVGGGARGPFDDGEPGEGIPGRCWLQNHLRSDDFISKSVKEVIVTISSRFCSWLVSFSCFCKGGAPRSSRSSRYPVSLIGTFSFLYALGISLNNLSLFGLVLAVGIVVDDAIVVVENVERNLQRGDDAQRRCARDDGRGRRRADRDCPDTVVRCSSRPPFSRASRASSFASSRSRSRASTVISCFVLADTQVPPSVRSCSRRMSRPVRRAPPGQVAWFGRVSRASNRGFEWLSNGLWPADAPSCGSGRRRTRDLCAC